MTVSSKSTGSSNSQPSKNHRSSTKKKKITLSAPTKPKKNNGGKNIPVNVSVNGSVIKNDVSPVNHHHHHQPPVTPVRTPSPLALSSSPPRTPPNLGSMDSVTTPPAQRSLSDVQLNSKKKVCAWYTTTLGVSPHPPNSIVIVL